MYHQRLQMYFRLIFIAIVNKAFGFDSQKKKKNYGLFENSLFSWNWKLFIENVKKKKKKVKK